MSRTEHFKSQGDGTVKKPPRKAPNLEQELYQTLFKEAEDGIFVSDSRGNYIEVNPRGCKMLGYTRREILSMNVRDLIPEEDLKNNPVRKDDLSAGKTAVSERRLRCKNGKLLAVEISGGLLPDGNLFGIVRDIGARKATDQVIGMLARFPSENPNPVLRVGADGKIQYANDASQPLLEEWKTGVDRSLPKAWKTFVAEQTRDGFRVNVDVPCGERVFSVMFVPIPEAGYVNLYGRDVTERRQAEEQARNFSRLYATLSQINQTIVRAKDRAELFQSICRVAVEFGKFHMAWIGWLDEQNGKIKPVAFDGVENGYLKSIQINIDKNSPLGQGPTGKAVREGKVAITQDIQTEPSMKPWQKRAVKRGYRSSAAVPFCLRGKSVGALNLYASKPGFFGPQEQELLAEIGMDISFALDNMEAEAQRRQAEEASRTARNLLDKTFASLDEAVLIVEPNTRTVITCNPAVERIFGYEEKEVIGRDTELLHVDRVWFERFGRELFPALDAVGVFHTEFQMRRKDGSIFPTENTVTEILDDLGRRTGVVSVVRDITERKQAEIRYRALFEQTHDAVLIIRLDGYQLIANQRAADMMGYTLEEIQNFPIFDMASDIEESLQVVEKLQRGEHVPAYERIFQKKDGSPLPVEVSLELVRSMDGQPLHIQAVVRDITERKQAEETLREMEAKFRALVEQTLVMIYTDAVDEYSSSIYTSPYVEAMLGYLPEEWVADSSLWPRLIHADDRARVLAEHKRTNETGKPFKMEYRLIHHDGHVVWVRDEAVLQRDEAGNPLHWQGVMIDITERKQAEEALRASEANQRMILNNIDEVVYMVDQSTPNPLQSVVRFVSERAEHILGYAPQEFLEDPNLWFHAIHPQDITSVQAQTAVLFESKQPGVREYRFRHKLSGEYRWMEDYIMPRLDKAGNIIGTFGVARDITERRQADEALRSAEEKYRSIFEDAVEGIFQSTPEGRFLTVNPALARMWGYASPEELISSTQDISRQVYVQPQRREEFAKLLQEQGSVRGFEYEVRRKDGGIMWISENARAVRDDNGTLLYYEGNIEDITERKQAEEALQKSEASLQAVLQSTADGILAVGPENEVRYANERFVEMWRIPPSVMASKTDSVILQHVLDQLSDPQSFLKKVAELYKSNEESLDTLYFKDGRVFERLSRPLLNGKELHGRVWSFRDITERKRAEEALRESENLLRESQVIAGLGSYVLDITTGFWKSSDVLDKVFGIDEAYERSMAGWATLIHPDDRKMMVDYFGNEVLGQGQTFNKEYRIIRHDNQAGRWVHGVGKLEFDPQGHPVSMHGTIQDITERKRHERELEAEAVLAQALSETLELQPLLERLLESARLAVPVAEKGSLALMADDEHLQVRAISGYQESGVLGFTYPIAWGYAGRVVRQRRPSLIADIQADAELLEAARGAAIGEIRDLRCAMAVPLLAHDTVIGVLSLESTLPDVFKEEDLRLLVKFAVPAALIIERRQAEEALGAAQAKYRTLVEQISAVIYIDSLDEFSTTRYISPQVKAMLGYSPEEWVAEPRMWLKVIHPDDLPAWQVENSRTNKTGERFALEYRLTARDGRTVWVRDEAVLMRDDSGQPLSWQGILVDITERKRAEEALRLRESYLTAILENQPGLVWLKDADSRFLTANQAFADSCGKASPAELVGKSDLDIWPKELAEKYKADDARIIKNKIPVVVEEPIFDRGKTAWFETFKTPILDDKGGVIGTTGYSHDITARKQAEEVLREHLAELEMLYESGLVLSQLLKPNEIGQKIIGLLEQKMNWHHTTIRLYHPENETLELLAFNQPKLKSEKERNEAEERFNNYISKPGEGLSGWAIQNSQIVRGGDVSNDPRYVDTYPGLHSGLYVPMRSGQRVIGVISIESEQPNAFSEADERLVATLANQAASALENARLFEETRQRVTELETVNRISIALRAISKQDEMLAIVLEETLAALDASHGSISLLNEATGKLHKASARGWLSEFTETPIQPGEGVFGKVFLSGNTHITHDFANDPMTGPESSGQLPPGWGGACVPIRSADQTLGVMLVSVSGERELSKDEIRLLNTLAEMTGNALHRMRLHEETVHRAEEFASLYETNTAISSEHELNTLVQTIVDSAASLLGASAGGMYLYDLSTEELEVVVATHPSIPIGTRLHLGEGGAGRVAQSRQPLRVDDYSTWEGRSQRYTDSPIRAILEVPILFGGELIGVLVAHEVGASERKYSKADERLLSLFAAQAAGVIRSARLFEETERRLENLQALHEVDRVITSSFDLRPILSTVINHMITQLGVDAADVLLLNPALQTLEYAAGQGFRTRGIERTNSRLGEGHAGKAALERRTIHIPNLPETGSNFMRASLLAGEKFLEYYGVPLVSKGEIKGVLEVFHRSPIRQRPEWLNFLETMADQAAIALDNAQLFKNLQRANIELGLAYDATIEGWSHAMDLRDEETEGHTQRVTEKAVALARAMDMRDDDILHLRRGALLHDIGKIGVSDHILLKPDKLTEEEWEIMRKHPQFAYEMLRPITYLHASLDIPYLHHEKWDGTGYPQGLKGEQIPLAARIFAIVDVFDALISDRPYRKAWMKADALTHIREQSGKHFDPEIVEKFLQLFGVERQD